jgi:hypothetical protein
MDASVKKFLLLISFGVFVLMFFLIYEKNIDRKSFLPSSFPSSSLSSSSLAETMDYRDSISILNSKERTTSSLLTEIIIKSKAVDDEEGQLNASMMILRRRQPVDWLYAYVNLPLDFKHGSNLIPLTMATLVTSGDMLELGMGLFSTPLLHKISFDFNRQLVSVDTHLDWMRKFAFYNQTQAHKLYHLPNEKLLSEFGLKKRWGMVLVDHIYAEIRPTNVIKFANLSSIVVAHDTEKANEGFYKYEQAEIRKHFKYVCKFSLYQSANKNSYISTTMLSNFIDLVRVLKPLFDNVRTEYGHESCNENL